MSDDKEALFKKIAEQYVNKDGHELKKTAEELNNQGYEYPRRLDDKVKNAVFGKKRRFGYFALPIAAAVLITAVYISNPLLNMINSGYSKKSAESIDEKSGSITSADKNSGKEGADNAVLHAEKIIQLASILPSGYTLVDEMQDNGMEIYFIESDTLNEITVCAEEKSDSVETEGFTAIAINGRSAYLLIKIDYSILKYEQENVMYTLTGKYGYEDLITISKKIIV